MKEVYAMPRFTLLLVALMSGLTFCSVCLAEVITVDLNGTGDFTAIQLAIDAAQEGDTVLVKPGEYVSTEPITFRGKAITVRGENGAEETTIRLSELASAVVSFENGEDDRAVLEGFTITGAGSRGSLSGSGVRCVNDSSPTLVRCTFSGNAAAVQGGVHCDDSSSPLLTDCTISGNYNDFGGGGVTCIGNSSPTLVNCTISGNRARWGGGVYCDDDSSPALINCAILGNAAFEGHGGGMDCDGNSAATLTNCTILGNFASDFPGQSGAVYCHAESSTTLTNCTISGNSQSGIYCEEGASTTLRNSIVWANSGGSVVGDPQVNYSLIEGTEVWPGESNINADPLFARPGIFVFHDLGGLEMPDFIVDPGEYSLSANSPAVDSGTSDLAPATDLEGNARPCGPEVDMGAYESCLPPFLRGECNDDGEVDLSDAVCGLNWLFSDGTTPGCIAALNSNGDAAVDIADPIWLLSFLFAGSAAPVEPFPDCGFVSSEKDRQLGCVTSPERCQ